MENLYFNHKILRWYSLEKRALPWRGISDPYFIWISEVILQQTRIDQGTSYYYRFIENFPTLESLATAKQDEVLKLWQGLGYYSRARNLHIGAQQILNKYEGKFPKSSAELKKIKGIGDYTAAAIASFAYNEVVPAIDGNVYRVLSRIFGIDIPIDSTSGKKTFSELACQLIDKKNPGDYNQAVMEFGALRCKPKNPLCIQCPFENECHARTYNKIDQLPVKSKKIKQRNRYFYYLFIEHDNKIYFKKRTDNDIWQNLNDFPLIETKNKKSLEDILKTSDWKNIFTTASVQINGISNDLIHMLTHQKIHVQFIHINIISEKNLASNFLKIDKRDIFELAVPKLIENYLSSQKLV